MYFFISFMDKNPEHCLKSFYRAEYSILWLMYRFPFIFLIRICVLLDGLFACSCCKLKYSILYFRNMIIMSSSVLVVWLRLVIGQGKSEEELLRKGAHLL